MWSNVVIDILKVLNLALGIMFFLAYFYQLVYGVVGLIKKRKEFKEATKQNKIAVVISARDESAVLPYLIDSVKKQDYPSELVDVIVVADNCSDNTTAECSREMGAIVYERKDKAKVGKGYALDYLFDKMMNDGSIDRYDAYLVLDADNLLKSDYIKEMNNAFESGYEVLTSYRNSKNFLENWITAGYGLWFLREARFLNNPRCQLGTSCAISGTGFMISRNVLKKYGGWKFHLLTEDLELSVKYAVDGGKIGYAGKAMFYDEQPTTFKKSWVQRMRWSKGFYQVFARYGCKLFKNMFGNFSCYDMMMNISPAIMVSTITIIVNLIGIIIGLVSRNMGIISPGLEGIYGSLLYYYIFLFVAGAMTQICEWKNVPGSAVKKIFYLFTFPLFMFTYHPIAMAALFKKKVEWKPIAHNNTVSIDEINNDK